MIPLKLQLKNFLSYGPDIQTIDLSAYPLICLSGKNGHGKSALLDAITWALWGQARKVTGNAKADQGLLRLGQTQMMVTLDFEFNAQIYRVKREFTLTYGKPLAVLEFGIVNADETFVPLTDKTISLTQDVIEQTLNLSFDSFSNSAFLRQGQANEFSKKSPKDRKEILATILGLNQYESIRKLAMEKMKQATTDKALRITMQEKMELELQKTGHLVAQMTDVDTQLKGIATQEGALAEQKQKHANAQQALFEDQKKYQVLAFHAEQLHKKETEYTELLHKEVLVWKTVHKKQLKLPDPKELTAQKQALLDEIKEHQHALQKNLEIKEQYLKQKEQAQQLVHELKEKQAGILNQKKVALERCAIEKQTIQQTITDLTRRSQESLKEKTSTLSQVDVIKTTLASQTVATEKHLALEKHFERRKEYYQKFLEQGKWLTSEVESLEQKKQLTHDDDNDLSCPLCEQNLSGGRKRFLKQKFVEQEVFLHHRLQRISKVVKQLKVILIEQHAQLEASRKQNEQFSMLQAKQEDLVTFLAKVDATIVEFTTTIATAEKKLHDITLQITAEQAALASMIEKDALCIEQNSQYIAFKAQLTLLENEAKKLTYNQELHKKSVEKLAVVERQIDEYMQLIEQSALQVQRQNTVGQLCTQLKQIRTEKKDIETQCHHYKDLPARKTAYEQQEIALITTAKELAVQKETLLEQKSSLKTQKTALETMQKEYQEQKQAILVLQESIYDYQAISAATGKDGIQALLIEDAIPEIEHEANSLLSRLTNNQAQVFFESLRDLKKGGSKETLDIKISDAAGIRPYEMFSGGEAFRIDFAIRIAISKLLARRAGTSLQTLIIDEGFGSQDEEGLALIMDALYKIQDDFSKIIIVSHLPSMKDQFPVHLFIQKGPNGSTVTVIEQG